MGKIPSNFSDRLLSLSAAVSMGISAIVFTLPVILFSIYQIANPGETQIPQLEMNRIPFAGGNTTADLFSGIILLLALLLSAGVYRVTLSLLDTQRRGRRVLERFQAVVQQSREAILLVSRSWQILDANPASSRLLNWQPDAAHPACLKDLLTFEPDPDEQFLLQAVQNGQVSEHHCIRHDGWPLVLELSASQICDQETHAFSVSLRDITARIQTEHSTLEREELFRTIFENATTGVCLVSLDGKFIHINHKLCAILGYTQEELLGLSFNTITHKEDQAIGINFLKQMLAGEIYNANFEKRFLHKGGDAIWALVSTAVVRNSKGEAQYFVTYIQDITERKQLEEKLRHDALHDPLTGLGNRNLLIDHLTQANERKKRKPDLLFALFFLDFDRFKMVNDSLGHYAGDQLLVEASHRLEHGLRSTDRITRFAQPETVARIAGDEFVILLEDFQSVEDIQKVAERAAGLLSSPYQISGIEVKLTASIGMVVPDQPYINPEDMIRDADIAMYRAKLEGGGKAVCYDPEMHRSVMARMQMESDLRQAVARNEFVVHYQPVYALPKSTLGAGWQTSASQDDPICGFEALVRWQSPGHGLRMPADFISLAEETGLINPIGYFVLEEACRQMKRWQESIQLNPDLILSVNLSSRQIMSSDLVEKVSATLERTGYDPKRLWLEVTESSLVQMNTSVLAQLTELRKMGICIEIDDFGTGYSSLSYLQNLPIDGLKIDRSFIRDIQGGGQQIVKSLIDLSHSLGLTAVAEGVETEGQHEYLQSLACDFAQGYLMSRPVSAAAFEESLKARDRGSG